jgi:hypothetical protein
MKWKILATYITIGTINFSCTKFVQVPPPPNLLSSSLVFSDSTDANSATLGLYVLMAGSPSGEFQIFNGDLDVFCGLSSDELISNTGIPDEGAAYMNALFSQNNTILGFWQNTYQIIYQANDIINSLPSSTGVSNTAKSQFIGEALFVRSFCYFNLINLFGEVPLVTTTNYRTNAVLPKKAISQVMNQIIADLNEAQNLLSISYPGTSGKVRANKYTAIALLSKAYLYNQNWDSAYYFANQVITSGVYSLETDLNNVFLTGSNEAIFQMPSNLQGLETTEGYNFVPTSNSIIPNYTINSPLLSAFETGDQRRVNWIDSNQANSLQYYFPYKYKLGYDGNYPPSEEYMIFRLGEQYLIRAESETMGAGGGTGSAISDINIIRQRAGLGGILASGQQQIMSAIVHERQVEMFCEWGNRWFDLKRCNLVDSVMGGVNGVCTLKGGTWSNYDTLYPVPNYEIQTNPFLTQNQGYN